MADEYSSDEECQREFGEVSSLSAGGASADQMSAAANAAANFDTDEPYQRPGTPHPGVAAGADFQGTKREHNEGAASADADIELNINALIAEYERTYTAGDIQKHRKGLVIDQDGEWLDYNDSQDGRPTVLGSSIVTLRASLSALVCLRGQYKSLGRQFPDCNSIPKDSPHNSEILMSIEQGYNPLGLAHDIQVFEAIPSAQLNFKFLVLGTLLQMLVEEIYRIDNAIIAECMSRNRADTGVAASDAESASKRIARRDDEQKKTAAVVPAATSAPVSAIAPFAAFVPGAGDSSGGGFSMGPPSKKPGRRSRPPAIKTKEPVSSPAPAAAPASWPALMSTPQDIAGAKSAAVPAPASATAAPTFMLHHGSRGGESVASTGQLGHASRNVQLLNESAFTAAPSATGPDSNEARANAIVDSYFGALLGFDPTAQEAAVRRQAEAAQAERQRQEVAWQAHMAAQAAAQAEARHQLQLAAEQQAAYQQQQAAWQAHHRAISAQAVAVSTSPNYSADQRPKKSGSNLPMTKAEVDQADSQAYIARIIAQEQQEQKRIEEEWAREQSQKQPSHSSGSEQHNLAAESQRDAPEQAGDPRGVLKRVRVEEPRQAVAQKSLSGQSQASEEVEWVSPCDVALPAETDEERNYLDKSVKWGEASSSGVQASRQPGEPSPRASAFGIQGCHSLPSGSPGSMEPVRSPKSSDEVYRGLRETLARISRVKKELSPNGGGGRPIGDGKVRSPWGRW